MEHLSPTSSTPAHRVVQADIVPQLRNALLAMRDLLFELQEATTRLADVIRDLHRGVLKVESAVDGSDDDVA